MAAIASLTTREYSSGSCTLQITGQLSPLSQVADKPVLVRSRFRLQLWPQVVLDASEEPSAPSPLPRLELSGQADQFAVLMNTVSRYVQSRLTVAETTGQMTIDAASSGVALHPLGLSRHHLTLDQGDASGQSNEVELSALELADLADVLEQADSDLYLAAATDLAKVRSSRPKLPVWIGSAAAVGIAAILGSQWLPLQTLRSNLPTATSTGEIALEDNQQESEAFSHHPPPAPETIPGSDSADAGDGNTITPEEIQPAEPPVPRAQPTSPPASAVPPAQPAPAPASPPSEKAGTASGATAPMSQSSPPHPTPQHRTAAPRPAATVPESTPQANRAPQTAMEPAAMEPADPSASSAQEEELSEAESLAVPSQERLRAPAAPDEAEAAAELSADQPVDTVAEAPWQVKLRQQLRQNWTPFAGQTETLSYRLSMDQNGILLVIHPLTELSRQHQGEIPWPAMGESIQEFPPGQAVDIELQFLPSGTIILVPVPDLPGDTDQE